MGEHVDYMLENSKRNMTTQKRHQNLDFTTIADRLRTAVYQY